jgi:hypothetical protein
VDNFVNNLKKNFLELSKYYQYICIMENTKYQYKTLKVTTKQEYKKAEKLLKSGWIFLNVLCDGEVIQFCKISKK